MKCEKCNSEDFAYITRQGKAINRKNRKKEKKIKFFSILLLFLLISLASYTIVFLYIATINLAFIVGVYIYYYIRKSRLPNEHIEMICKDCGAVYIVDEE